MSQDRTQRIARNTMVMYARMLFVMAVTLYAVRVLLSVLGVEDYGLYNVVAGVVSLFTVLSLTMSMATQRFYSYALGEKDADKFVRVFSASLRIYFYIAAIVLAVGETVGVWFINTQLTIPDGRMAAVNWVFQFSLIGFLLTIMSVPYSSAIIVHENMALYAAVTVVDCLLKLAIIYAAKAVSFDRMIAYGLFMLFVQLITSAAYFFACRIKYRECRYRRCRDKSLFKDILSFSGWTIFGFLANVANNQGNNILINIFFGPIANAARAVSFQVGNALTTLCNSFFMAVRPPLIKSYAEGDYDYLFKLFYFSNKFIYYLLLICCLPILFKTNDVLTLWLHKSSEDMVVFTQLTLVYTILLSLNNPVTALVQASGTKNVKRYHLWVETFILLSLPLTYLIFKWGWAAKYSLWITASLFLFAHFIRLVILKKSIPIFSLKGYLEKFVVPAAVVTILSTTSILILAKKITFGGFKGFAAVALVSIVITAGLTWMIGLKKEERTFVRGMISRGPHR